MSFSKLQEAYNAANQAFLDDPTIEKARLYTLARADLNEHPDYPRLPWRSSRPQQPPPFRALADDQAHLQALVDQRLQMKAALAPPS